jgi:hypothetical protein
VAGATARNAAGAKADKVKAESIGLSNASRDRIAAEANARNAKRVPNTKCAPSAKQALSATQPPSAKHAPSAKHVPHAKHAPHAAIAHCANRASHVRQEPSHKVKRSRAQNPGHRMNNARKRAANPVAAEAGADGVTVAVAANAANAVNAASAWSGWNQRSENAHNRQNTQFVQNAPSAGTKPKPKCRRLRPKRRLRRSTRCQRKGLPPLRLQRSRLKVTP